MDNKLYKKIIKYIRENFIFIFLCIVILLSSTIKIPYTIYRPGSTINIENRLDNIVYKSKGSINLTYVSTTKGTPLSTLISLIMPNWDMIKNKDIVYEDSTLKEESIRDKIYLDKSISDATYNAYSKANKDFIITETHYKVTYVLKDSNSKLRVGDELIAYDDHKIKSLVDFNEYISNLDKDSINLKIKRNNKEMTINDKFTLIDGEKKLGIIIFAINEYDESVVKYQHSFNEGGSSGGLMLSLSIYNSITKDDITKGLKISGTGTIESDGSIGKIAGVKYKLIGAVRKKSDIFIVPQDNYEEAIKLKKKYKYNIDIIKAQNINQVIDDLNAIKK